jgi:RecA/RadA recombinase
MCIYRRRTRNGPRIRTKIRGKYQRAFDITTRHWRTRFEITESLVRSGKIDVIVIDSVAALTPKDEIEGDMGQSHVGKQARLMSQALRKLTASLPAQTLW